jgi:hypothetical protein
MTFTVLWTNDAERELADLCVAHFQTDLAAISAAANSIDVLLRHDPQTRGAPNFDVVRSIHVPPVAADFEVDQGDCKVYVLTVWYTG